MHACDLVEKCHTLQRGAEISRDSPRMHKGNTDGILLHFALNVPHSGFKSGQNLDSFVELYVSLFINCITLCYTSSSAILIWA